MFLWVPSSTSIWRGMSCIGRLHPWLLEGKDIRRIDLRGNVYRLSDRGSGECSRETHAQLLGAYGG